jgi:hypothetical protein
VEVAYREDFRRTGALEMALKILNLALTSGSDPEFRGYCHRRRRRRSSHGGRR